MSFKFIGIQNLYWRKVFIYSQSTTLASLTKVRVALIMNIALYLLEEAFYAALDLKQFDWANAFVKIVGKQHP
jgi:hypothetical protein